MITPFPECDIMILYELMFCVKKWCLISSVTDNLDVNYLKGGFIYGGTICDIQIQHDGQAA